MNIIYIIVSLKKKSVGLTWFFRSILNEAFWKTLIISKQIFIDGDE